jgi:ketosteroid isomerase-like protein
MTTIDTTEEPMTKFSWLRRTASALVVLCTVAPFVQAQDVTPIADSAAIVGTIERFHDAISRADSSAALALLTDDVVVLEAGGFETRAEFRQHHLAADIQFAQSAKVERQLRAVKRRGDVAWVTATSTATRTVDGRESRSSGAELMVLVLTASGWRISAIHWSSRTRRP